ncbi:MAG: carboxylesterase family protein [Lachnospiraceae bacterium]|nr:carboxylesterase family protein [Lachnospiraceae bacterium]
MSDRNKGKRNKKRILKIIGIMLLVLMVITAAVALFLWITVYRTSGNFAHGKVFQATDKATVNTTYGTIRGAIDDGVYTYHGIKYGKASERFVPAEKPDTWSGIRDTVEYGEISPQGAIFGQEPLDYNEGDNDCLNLNLWTPAIGDGGNRPVMVWFHGGGFSIGSGNDEEYDGHNLAKDEDVVVVTVNHRLNVYGFLDLSDYGDKYKYSANVGIYDLIDALDWVRSNAANFGGNPNNTTVFGQSGGGGKILALMTSPYAKGLFDKAIVQSGATDVQGAVFTDKEVSEYLTERMLDELSIKKSNIEDIQYVDNEELQEASVKALSDTAIEFKIPIEVGEGYALEWQPVVDGDFIPTNPITGNTFAKAGFDIPLLIGSNLEEWAPYGDQTHEVNSKIENAFGKAYINEDEDIAGNTDVIVRQPTLKIMKHKAAQGGADVYGYVYTYQSSAAGAAHSSEIPYVFRNTSENSGLTDMMSGLWTSFARNGVPSYRGVEKWEPYTAKTGATMILDEKPYLTYKHDEKLLELINPGYKY